MIESVNNERAKFYKKLRDKKYILEYGKFIVEGEHLVREAYNANVLEEIIYTDENYLFQDVKSEKVSFNVMKSISKLNSVPNVMGVVRLIQNSEILGNKIVLLDNVQDPGNVGTIIRSAVAFNVSTVVMSMDSVSLYNDKMVRASEGMIFKMNVVRMDLTQAIDIIKSKGIKVYYADMNGNIDLDNANIKNYALVLGSEGQGISDNVRTVSDDSIKIPINGDCESLNVSVSGGIIMYKFR
jgi:TrmH family RNA methyltransferase